MAEKAVKTERAQWKIDLDSIKKKMGPSWSTADVKAWLSNQGFGPNTTQKEFDATNKDQPQTDVGIADIPGVPTTGNSQALNSLFMSLVDRGNQTQDAPKPKPAAKAKPLPNPSQAAATVQQSPYEQLANALASEYLGQVNQLMPLTSGSALPGLTSQVTNQAAAAVPGAGGWLQQQAGAEQKAAQAAGLPQAMNAVGEAQAQGALPYAGAIANTGVANTQYLEAAPWQQILTELASETAYKAASSQGAAAFGATPQNTPAFLQQIFKNLGLAGTATAPGGGLSAPGTAAKGGAGSTSSATSNTPSQTG